MQTYTVESLTRMAYDHIDALRPVRRGGMAGIRVLPVQIVTQNITYSGLTAGTNKTQLIADATAYASSLGPGEALYLAQLIALAIGDGSQNAGLVAPAGDVIPTAYQMVRPGVVTAP